MSRTYSHELFEQVQEFLREDDWKFLPNEEFGLIRMGLSLGEDIKKIEYIIDVHDDNIIVYAQSPIGPNQGDREMMGKMQEFICRANYGLKNGNFELDCRDGEIRYKCFVDCADLELSTAVLRNSVFYPASMFAKYSKGIVGVLYKDMSPEEAVDLCEGRFREKPEADEELASGQRVGDAMEGIPSLEEFARMLGASEILERTESEE